MIKKLFKRKRKPTPEEALDIYDKMLEAKDPKKSGELLDEFRKKHKL